jgi:hypothetical protein
MSVANDGLERVLAELEAEASEADDFVDAHFTRAQINLYRIRKLIVGERAAQRLLVNPAIAAIAEQETAAASAEQLDAFITAAKTRTVSRTAVNAVLNPPADAGMASARSAAMSFEAVNPVVAEGTRAAVFERARLAVFESTRGAVFESVERFAGGERVARIESRDVVLRDVLGDRPESGPTLPPRGLSIGQRFVEPPATQNLSYARAALTDLVNQLPRIRLALVGETVRSLSGRSVELLHLQGRAAPTADSTTEELRNEAMATLFTVTELLADTDEAEVTMAALDFTDIKSGILRTIERVVQQRRTIIQNGIETVAALAAQRAAAAARVLAIEGKLTEARHDVSVARALRQEEQQRVAAVNERRDSLIRDEVRFLAYVRPRTVDLVRRQAQYWKLEPFDVPAPVPACLQRHDEPPPA